jgi:DNA mismatch repair protein MutL
VNRIRLLPEHVANQIAAGEVVERPASVVKELVENALDAGAQRITVEIGAGGRSLIRVTDDGCGMSRDDALLCLERHATSKLQRAEDLAGIATMGFRGEAIPSIASVSRFTLTTREQTDASGEASQIVINGGRITEVKVAASPPGTSVEVRQLFFNLPARRKFLRAEETERAHIQHYLTLAALAWPHVGFQFVTDGRPVWNLPPLAWMSPAERLVALRERLRNLQGSDIPMLDVDFSTEIESAPDSGLADEPLELREGGATARVKIWGVIGAPGVSRPTRESQHVFVNQRPVENRGLNFALIEGYHTALMKGRYPVCCLFLEIDPAAVDVNIHPQKREVKFREEMAVRRIMARAVREALVRFHATRPETERVTASAAGAGIAAGALSIPPSAAGLVGPSASESKSTATEFVLAPGRASKPAPAQPVLPMSMRSEARAVPSPVVPESPPVSTDPEVLSTMLSPAAERRDAEVGRGVAGASGAPVPLLQVPLRLLGVIGRLYVVLESDRGLVLMDQHAAHERVLFEEMLNRLESAGQAASQRLLLPETVELPARDAEFVRRNVEMLSRLGIGLREFGERTFLLEGLPPFVRTGRPQQFVLALIDELKAAGPGVNSLRLGEDVIAKTVCRHAVKANDALNHAELERLVDNLRRCSMPYTCPHGRPTLIEMNWRDLEKRFGRTA